MFLDVLSFYPVIGTVTDSIRKYDIIGHKTGAKSRQIENVLEEVFILL